LIGVSRTRMSIGFVVIAAGVCGVSVLLIRT